MTQSQAEVARIWAAIGRRFLPFADAATPELPLGRLLRLALFQVSVGMAIVMLNGTLNRVMVVELGVSAWLVATMVSIPLLFAPLRVLLGHRSDTHRSALGWRRVPYIWFGTILQFGGFSIMPFALLVMGGDAYAPAGVGQAGAALAFLLVGAGLHTTQTAGLALATDLAPEEARPRVVALLYVMLLLGMVGSAMLFGALLADFSPERLIKVVQGAAVATLVLNVIALWKQEARDRRWTQRGQERAAFRPAWNAFWSESRPGSLLVVVGLGTAGFSMQDILLEPYGGQVLDLSVGATTLLTAMLAGGTLLACGLAARLLSRGGDPHRIAAVGAVIGLVAFMAVIASAPLDSPLLFRSGTGLIGFGGGLFAVGTLTAAMGMAEGDHSGLALAAWGAVQASAAGLAIALGGALRDLFNALAADGSLGPALTGDSTGYLVVYHIEIVLLLATLVAIVPLVRYRGGPGSRSRKRFGLADFPG